MVTLTSLPAPSLQHTEVELYYGRRRRRRRRRRDVAEKVLKVIRAFNSQWVGYQ